MQPSRLNLQAGGPGFGGADIAATCGSRVSPACILDLVVAVNVAVIGMILFQPHNRTVGRDASPPTRAASPPATADDKGRAPTGCNSAPIQAAVEAGSPSGLPAAVYSLFPAISWTESRDDDDAVGDRGKSRGRYQIGLPYWTDGGGDPARYSVDVLDPTICRRVMLRYWRRYCPVALAAGDLETLAKVHNGGPRGASKAATRAYWLKVKGSLQ